MKLLFTAMVMLMAITFISCGNASNTKSSDIQLSDITSAKEEDQSMSQLITDTTATPKRSSNAELRSGNPVVLDWDKKLIKTADIRLELKEFQTFNATIHNGIKRFGAYIANEQLNQADDRIENMISIKVPVAQFEDLVNALPGDGVKILEKRISTQDVTGEVVDTKARVEARKQVRDQYLSLLKKANKMKDIVEVQKEINAIQEDIEAGTGRADYLSHEAAYSTVNLTYFQYVTPSADNDNPTPAFSTKLKDAFDSGISIVSNLILGLITIWPVLAGAGVMWLLYKKNLAGTVKPAKKD